MMAWSTPKQMEQAKLWLLLGTVTSARRYLIHWQLALKREKIFLEINGMLAQLHHIEVEIRTRMKKL